MGNTENGGNCRKNEIVYKIICKVCQDVYIGETARNGHSRGLEHTKDSTSNNKEEKERSVLLRHMQEKHEGNNVNFDMKVVASYQHNPLARQCAEAIHIKNIEPEKRINNKTEYHQPGEVEIRYEKNEPNKMINKSTNPNKQNNTETAESQTKNDQQEIRNRQKVQKQLK